MYDDFYCALKGPLRKMNLDNSYLRLRHRIYNSHPLIQYTADKYLYLKKYRQHVKLARISPELLVHTVYRQAMQKAPDGLLNPLLFNEKLNWLKLHWYDPRAIVCSNKFAVRSYVRELGLGDILINLCGQGEYNSFDEIDFSELPDRFVLKPTHDSGHCLICRDKSHFDIKLAKKNFEYWLKVDYCYMAGEWPYHSEKPTIICEDLLEDCENGELFDYKFFCFNGIPEMIFLYSNRVNQLKCDIYNLNWEKQDYRYKPEPSGKIFPRPKKLDDMIRYAGILSKGFPFVRVDFYEVAGRVYFGEMTFFHGGGRNRFFPEVLDRHFGNKIILPDEIHDPWKILRITEKRKKR